jgi:chromosome segregation ATPase
MDDCDAKAAEVIACQARLDEFEAWSTAARERIAQLESEERSQLHIEKIEESFREKLLQSEKVREELESEISLMKSDLGEIKSMNSKIESLSSSVEQLEAANRDLLDSKLSLDSDNAVLKQQLAEMLQRVEQYHALENALKTAEESLTAIQAELANTESEGLDVVHQWEQRTKELEAAIDARKSAARSVGGYWTVECQALSVREGA